MKQEKNDEYFIYLLECSDGTLYTGSTNNLEKRLLAHNSSKSQTKYKRIRQPVVMKYHEKFENKSLALKREWEIKRLGRNEKLALIKGNTA